MTKEFYAQEGQANEMPNRAPEGLTKPRDTAEHKNNTLSQVIAVIAVEHGSQAASSDFPGHPLTSPKQTAAINHS